MPSQPGFPVRKSSQTPTALLLAEINRALSADDTDSALRNADRLRRTHPDNALIRHLLGRILGRRGAFADGLVELDAAARILQAPEIEASAVEILLQLERKDEAMRRLARALGMFALTPELAAAARSVCARLGASAAGWVGVTSALELRGEAPGTREVSQLGICLANGDPISATVTMRHTGGRTEFSMTVPPQPAGTGLTVRAGGLPLLGSDIAYPPLFRVDGRAAATPTMLEGWVSLGWLPGAAADVEIEDAQGGRTRVATTPDPANPGRHQFALDLTMPALAGPQVIVSVLLPDGTTECLPDQPLLLESASLSIQDQVAKPPRKIARQSQPRETAIIVPVYLGLAETRACLDSLIATVAGAEIIVIDDASPDREISRMLDEFAAAGHITLLRNSENSGFAASVNRGIARAGMRDVVVLNSDVMVHHNWLERMRSAAYRDADIATVTPLADDGSVVSYPAAPGPGGDSARAAELDAITATVNAGIAVNLPVGIGFCLFIRHECLAETGQFDAPTFAQGYGEETDFCMRARAAGWRHVAAADVFVHHTGGSSFGARRAALLDRSARITSLRYPGYDAFVQAFIDSDTLGPVRRRIDEARLRDAPGRFALLVSHALGGGVARHVAERADSLREQGFSVLILEPSKTDPANCVLRDGGKELAHLYYAVPDELPLLGDLLADLRFGHIEIHHFLGHTPKLVELIRALGIPYDVYIHDYVWICPRITLMTGESGYCGEPDVSSCEVCIETHGSHLGETISVAQLRGRSAWWLYAAQTVIAPSLDAAERLARYFPGIKIQVQPWEVPVTAPAPLAPAQALIRVAVIGAINASKGYWVLLECARDAAARGLGIEFLFLGYTQDDDSLMQTGKVFITGKYEEEEIAGLLARERPHLALFASQWPETWCFALTHALQASLPVVAFDIGAVAERLRQAGIGTLVATTTSAADLNDLILRVAAEHWPDKVLDAPAPARRIATSSKRPGAAEAEFPVEVAPQRQDKVSSEDRHLPPERPLDDLTATVKPIVLQPGLYAFLVDNASPQAWQNEGSLVVPAIHVTAGPGVAADAVEFMPAIPARGTWLYESGDALIANVRSKSTTVLVNSIRAPNTQPLAIKIERIGERTGKITPSQAAAAIRSVQASQTQPHSDVPLEILAHVQNRGDLRFVDVAWAGRVAPGLAIEAISITPREPLSAGDMEYKGLTATGFETPWVGNGGLCGTKGKSTPLIGFAVRLKSRAAAQFDCEYSGYFRSGKTVGPLRNGTPCRSTSTNDPLEGISVRLIAKDAARHETGKAAPQDKTSALKFGKFRDILESTGEQDDTVPKPAKSRATAKSSKPDRTRG